MFSWAKKAETDFFFLGEGMLVLGELNMGAMSIDKKSDRQVLEKTFLDQMVDENGVTDACKRKIAAGETVLRWDCHEIMRQIAHLREDTDAAVTALAAIKDIGQFRFWQSGMPNGTVLHALAQLDRPQDEMQGWIKTLVDAGVPVEAVSQGKDYYGNDDGRGNALQVAVMAGNEGTARAFAAKGLDIDARMGTHSLSAMILRPLDYTAKYPNRSSKEQKEALVSNITKTLDLVKAFGMPQDVLEDLEKQANKHLKAIRINIKYSA